MSHALIVRPEAEADIAKSFAWYESELSGLGAQFLDSLDDAFERISSLLERFSNRDTWLAIRVRRLSGFERKFFRAGTSKKAGAAVMDDLPQICSIPGSWQCQGVAVIEHNVDILRAFLRLRALHHGVVGEHLSLYTAQSAIFCQFQVVAALQVHP